MPGIVTRPPPPKRSSHGQLSREVPPPEPREPPDGGGGGDWELLTVASNHVIAYLIQGRLAQEGIDVVLDASNASPGAWLHPFGDMSSPVKVFVRRSDLPAASLLLHEVDHPPERAPDRAGLALGASSVRRPLPAFRVAVAVVAALALSGLLVFGPCVSHWFCV